jgi:hypothetical protein
MALEPPAIGIVLSVVVDLFKVTKLIPKLVCDQYMFAAG